VEAAVVLVEITVAVAVAVARMPKSPTYRSLREPLYSTKQARQVLTIQMVATLTYVAARVIVDSLGRSWARRAVVVLAEHQEVQAVLPAALLQ
jgi:hypothetical protein